MVTALDLFPSFYNHPTISSLSSHKRWTISDPSTKIPLDLFELLYNRRRLGCDASIPFSCGKLYDIFSCIPIPKNHALFLDYNVDDVMVLDVERNCSTSLISKFFRLPYLYVERSMSGEGFHFVLPLPKNFDKFPNIHNKTRLQSKGCDFELLMQHWVTFTRDMVSASSNPNGDFRLYNSLFENLASYASCRDRATIDDSGDASIDSIAYADDIIDFVCRSSSYDKQPSDFFRANSSQPDLSRWETSFLAHKYHVMINYLYHRNLSYTKWQHVVLLYNIALDCIPHRDKHDTFRQGKPYLLYLAEYIVATSSD